MVYKRKVYSAPEAQDKIYIECDCCGVQLVEGKAKFITPPNLGRVNLCLECADVAEKFKDLMIIVKKNIAARDKLKKA